MNEIKPSMRWSQLPKATLIKVVKLRFGTHSGAAVQGLGCPTWFGLFPFRKNVRDLISYNQNLVSRHSSKLLNPENYHLVKGKYKPSSPMPTSLFMWLTWPGSLNTWSRQELNMLFRVNLEVLSTVAREDWSHVCGSLDCRVHGTNENRMLG